LNRRQFLLGSAFALTCLAPLRLASAEEVKLPDWKALRALYEYDAKKPFEVEEKPIEDANYLKLHLSLVTPSGERAPGVFMRPKATGRYPIVVLLHGLTSHKESMLSLYGYNLLTQGCAILALDAPRHGERRNEGENVWQADLFVQITREGVRDYRRALDYLARRDDVDMKRTGLIGYSMGAMMGTILTAVDKRVKNAILCVGGDVGINRVNALPEAQRKAGYAICTSLYVAHIAPRPVLMLNGKADTIVSPAATKLVYDAAGKGKEIVWFESGHDLPKEAATKAVEWMQDRIGKK
jgi:predicted esterase